MKKKGSLQLSINAIVVLILAITILGLGLAFIKTQFSSVEGEFGRVSGQIKSDLIKDIEDSGELLTLNRVEFAIGQGEEEEFYMGVKNTQEDDRCFFVHFYCIQALSGECPDNSGTATSSTIEDWDWLRTFSYRLIKSGDVAVFSVKLQAAGSADTYLGKVVITKTATSAGIDDGSVDCISSGADYTTPYNIPSGDDQYHQEKQFTIELG